MTSALTKAYKAISGLNDLNYILDRRNDGTGKVALKRFFFFDNTDNAYRALAGRNVQQIDQDKLQGEVKLTKLRRFEQVWQKYGATCVKNKNNLKVKEIVSNLQDLMKDIGDIKQLESIIEVSDKDHSALKTLDTAIRLLEEDSDLKDELNQKKIAFNETTSFLKKEIKQLEGKVNFIAKKFNEEDLKKFNLEEFMAEFSEYETLIEQYDKYLIKNLDILPKSTIAKHHAFLDEKEKDLIAKRKLIDDYVRLHKTFTEFKHAERALSYVSKELSEKIKERNKWDPPEKYARFTTEELKKLLTTVESALKEHSNIDEEAFDNKDHIKQDRSELHSEILILKELTSENHIQNKIELDRQVSRLQAERDALFRSKNSLQDKYLTLKAPLIGR